MGQRRITFIAKARRGHIRDGKYGRALQRSCQHIQILLNLVGLISFVDDFSANEAKPKHGFLMRGIKNTGHGSSPAQHTQYKQGNASNTRILLYVTLCAPVL